jgi:hypothetical protein
MSAGDQQWRCDEIIAKVLHALSFDIYCHGFFELCFKGTALSFSKKFETSATNAVPFPAVTDFWKSAEI